MKILVLGINYSPEQIGIAVYTAGLCEDLARLGHKVRVVTAKPYYPQWRIPETYRGGWTRTIENGVEVTRCPLYVPAQPSGARRIVHHISFALSAVVPMIRDAFRFKPDVVIAIAPSLIAAPLARLAAWCSGGKCWLHVQDFEVDAAFATGLLDVNALSGKLARILERKALAGFARISSISPEMCAKLQCFGISQSRIVEFRNWAEAGLRPSADPSPYREEWKITTPHVALYSGNIANKQGIEIVVEAARRLRNRRDLTFVICGQGPNRATLEALAGDLDNVIFQSLQPMERLPDLLGLATVHLLPQKGGAADLVLPSKLANMLASGRPVVATALAGTGLAREVEGCGLVTAPGDAIAFADAIETLIDAPGTHRALSEAARQRGEEVWDRGSIIAGLERKVCDLASASPVVR